MRGKFAKVFVYGTLRQNKKATHTLHGYQLYDLGPFPCIIKKKGASVKGNILLVTGNVLGELDYIEGTARGFFTREKVKVDNTECYVYVAGNVLDEADPVAIPSGDWHDHPSKQKHVFRPFRS